MADDAASTLNPGFVRKVQLFIAHGFGSGLAKRAPGTVGTAAAVVCWLPFSPLAYYRPFQYIVLCLVLLPITVWAASGAELHYKRHDVGNIVIDEFIGFFITMIAIPATIPTVLLGFVVFRVLDIVKIQPAKRIDRTWPGGWGVVLDDVVSGIYANILLQIAIRVAPKLLGLSGN